MKLTTSPAVPGTMPTNPSRMVRRLCRQAKRGASLIRRRKWQVIVWPLGGCVLAVVLWAGVLGMMRNEQRSAQAELVQASNGLAGAGQRQMAEFAALESVRVVAKIEAAYNQLAWGGTFVLMLLTLAATGLAARMAVREGEEDELRQAYRVATEGGREGFYLWRSVWDANGEIADFELVDCNLRGAAFCGLTKDELIGRRYADLYPGAYGDKMIELQRQAFDANLYEDDFEPPPNSVLKGSWFHRKMVRTRDCVAVTLRDMSELREHALAMARMANQDVLTGLLNRHWLTVNLPAILARSAAEGRRVGLLFIDLDDFKKVNDTHGHATGDDLLRGAAERLMALVRPCDSVVRLGGDEFTVLVNPIVDAAHVDELAQRIVDAFKAPFCIKTHNNYVGTSIGVALFPDDADSGETLLLNADMAMYSAKIEKSRYCFYNKLLHESRQNRLETERELRLAIERDELLMHYQPRVDAHSGRLVGLEALVRWQHPQRGLVQPCEFIAIAESSELISRLGRLVISKVCAQLHAWQLEGLDVVPVAINVSARQINHSEVHEALSKCLEEWTVSASLVEVELTESAMMDESEEILGELERIAAMGVNLHVDDFGTGYSSLALLQRLQLDVLKVDRAFTSKLGITAESAVLFGAIVSMAHGLSMRVIAEGVETREQLDILRSLNCDELQGFYISRPVAADAVPALLARKHLFPA